MNTTEQPAKKIDHTVKNPVTTQKPVEAQGDHPEGMGVLDGATIGVGVVGGASCGMAAGLAAGPIGVVAGAVIGAVAGAFAGRGLGLLIDPTTEDDWLKKEFSKRNYVKPGQTYEEFVPFYRFGAKFESDHIGRSFNDVEPEAKVEFEKSAPLQSTPWDAAKPAIADGFDRSKQLRTLRAGS